MLTTLSLTNWRGRNDRYTLGRKTVVVGPPQSGKTGVLDGIEYLGWNETRAGKGTRGQSDFVSGGTALIQADIGSVTFTRDAEGRLKAVRVGDKFDFPNTRAEMTAFLAASSDKRREWLVRMLGAESVLAIGRRLAEARAALNGLRKQKHDHEAANRVSVRTLATTGRAPDEIQRDIDSKTARDNELSGIIARVKALQESRQPILDELAVARAKLAEAEKALAATPRPTADIAALEKSAQDAADALKVIDGFIVSVTESERQSEVEKRRAEEALAKIDRQRILSVGEAVVQTSRRYAIPDDDEQWEIIVGVVNQAIGSGAVIALQEAIKTADGEIAAYDKRLTELVMEQLRAHTTSEAAALARAQAKCDDDDWRRVSCDKDEAAEAVSGVEARLNALDTSLGEHTAGVEPYEAEQALIATELAALRIEWTEATNARAAAAASAKAASECAALDKQIDDKKTEIEKLDAERTKLLGEHVDPVRGSMRNFLGVFGMCPAIEFGEDEDFIGVQHATGQLDNDVTEYGAPVSIETMSGCETLVFGMALFDALLRKRGGGLLMMDAELLPYEWLTRAILAFDDAPYQVILSAYCVPTAGSDGWTIVEAK